MTAATATEGPRRPFGITVIVTAMITNAAIAAIRVYLGEHRLDTYMEPAVHLELTGPFIGALGLIVSVGLWRLRHWAWSATMLWAGVNMVQALLVYYRGEPQFPSMALSVLIVLYLNQREVQLAFIETTRGLIRDE
jgi:hypothetical protein